MPNNIAELETASASADKAAQEAGGTDAALNKAAEDAKNALSQAKTDPSQNGKRSDKEIAEFNLKKKAEEARALGIDPASVLGIKAPLKVGKELSDDTPLTIGTLRELEKQNAQTTALQMAQELPEDERDAVIDLLTNRIIPSGDAKKDFDLAHAAANSDRNAKIAQEAARGGRARRTAAGGSSNAASEAEFTPTPEEQVFMSPPYNVPKAKILADRKKAAEANA